MAGQLQPLDIKFPIVDAQGRPTEYFTRWAQQKQIDLGTAITLGDLETFLTAHKLQSGLGIKLTPDGDLNNAPTIAADIQALLDSLSSTRGAILFRGNAGWQVLLPGTAGNFLQTAGAGADPTWVPPSGGGGGMFTLLQSQTVSGVASVKFDNTKITSTYGTYFIRFNNVVTSVAGGAGVVVQVSPDNGVTIRTTNYTSFVEEWGVTTNFATYAQAITTAGLLLAWAASNDATSPFHGDMYLYGLPSATLKKTSKADAIGKAGDGNVYSQRNGGLYTVAEAINCILIAPLSGTLSGTFELWGVN